MLQRSKEELTERRRLRFELTLNYLKQSNEIYLFGIPSKVIERRINELRTELKSVDKASIGRDDDRTRAPRRSPKRKKAPWRCSFPDCNKIMPSIDKAIKFRKRHYCSIQCSLADDEKKHNSLASRERGSTSWRGH